MKKIKSLVNLLSNNFLISYFLFKISPPFWVLFGTKYREIYKSLAFTTNVQLNNLLKIANYGIQKTKFYKDSKTSRLKSITEFEETFTTISKENLNNSFNEFKSQNFSLSKYDLMTTGGTSGAPTKFFVPKDRYKKEFAIYHKIWSSLGYKKELRGVLRNEKLPIQKIYKLNPVTKELIFDGFRNNDNYYQQIYESLIKFKVYYIQGYPSSVFNFFVYVKTANLDTSFIKGIFLSSEIFLKHQRKLLKEDLSLPIISVYGHSEKLVLAVDFKGNNEYQVIEEYGYLELLDQRGNVIREKGVLGEIVGTTFDNYGMPLIRYRTGDFSSYLQYKSGTNRVLDGIQGRWQEMKIFNYDGSFVTPTALNLHDDLYNCINGLQYFQSKKGKLEVRIIPNKNYNEIVENKFLSHFKDRMAPDSLISIIKVDELKKRKNGKFILLESQINL
ncbi:MAG: CoF synthetase [Flavobacteriaceae bacterium]|nr:MAG: CoF synthetase [Flavobacteriaceae bacterium]